MPVTGQDFRAVDHKDLGGVVMQKKWYASKTIWVNGLAFVATVVQVFTGFNSPEIQGLALTLINVILRAVTKEEIVW